MASKKSKEAANLLCFIFELIFDLVVIIGACINEHK